MDQKDTWMTTQSSPCTFIKQAERLPRFRLMGDPLADAAVADLHKVPSGSGELISRVLEGGIDSVPEAPESWRELFHQVDHVPYWVNWQVLNRASSIFLKAGGLGVFALGCYVTPLFYRLSRGNKALAFSGDLHKRAGRRGRETARFVIETCLPHNLQRQADGFKVTLRVRLMHAHVRMMILKSGRWDDAQNEMPISQCYMAAMNVLLSMGWIRALRQLGFRLCREEEESIIQLWRYSAYLSGIDPELQFGSFDEAAHFWELVLQDEPPPDEDSRALISALLAAIPDGFGMQGKAAERMHAFCCGLSSALLGKELSRQLELKRTPWRFAAPVLRGIVPAWRLLDGWFPPVHRWSQYWGTHLWLNLSEYPPQGGLEMFAPRSGS
ncbi:MAG: hypothetical protein RI897_1916 [Verrucomicrobiota bacterium]|jgi:hypothetical protein